VFRWYKNVMDIRPGRAEDGYELVIASNRLPVTLSLSGEEMALHPSSGGLVAALRGTDGPHKWVGWPGTSVPDHLQAEATKRLEAEGWEPVFLSDKEQEDFYGRISNDTIWPLFHYFVDRLQFTTDAWETYVQVNERFADTIAHHSAPGARVWIHDFHLALVPAALRRRRPDLAIGYFLHIPFPSSEIYRVLPTRAELLRGLLGADYIGFHTGDYARHFRSSCLRVLGLESEPDSVEHDGRRVGFGVNPIGIDVGSFRETLHSDETARLEEELTERYQGKQLVLGIERLDYTKGIPQKLDAFERILEQDPARAQTITMLQVLVPSRLESQDYQTKRDEIEMRIAHLNGRFGQPGRTPVEYLHRSISHPELAALYRRADVMMVTPLRDGMNLVAQEFVLCQAALPELEGSWNGVLLLSEFAGAANLLPGALLVNPWDANDMADRLLEALALDPLERRRRLELMADRVEQLDSRRWAEGFLKRLDRYAPLHEPRSAAPLDEAARERISGILAAADTRTMLFDYDGTLCEFASHPDLAAPTPEIRDLLCDLASLPRTTVHLVSGRKRETLDSWFGELPIYLCAEHGYVARAPGSDWRTAVDVDLSWLPRLEEVFTRVTDDVPGTVVERKQTSVAWHYRGAEPEYGSWRARELLVALDEILAGIPAEVIAGSRVIEVRARGIHKGTYVETLFPDGTDPSNVILAAGDDLTDMDLYRALPAGSITLHVGGRAQSRVQNDLLRDQYLLDSPQALRRVLRAFVAELSVPVPLAAG
jgi:trehalose 6-phosphate synthase/phosphatase